MAGRERMRDRSEFFANAWGSNYRRKFISEVDVAGSSSLHLLWGQSAVAYTRRVLWIGAGNFNNDTSDPRFVARKCLARFGLQLFGPAGVSFAAAAAFGPEVTLIARRMAGLPNDFMHWLTEKKCVDWSCHEFFQQKEQERVAARGSQIAIGNCEEHAAVCYLYLRDLCPVHIRPIEVMHTDDHAFVVIGRENEQAGVGQPWGEGAVICDAYYNEVYVYTGSLRKRQQGAKKFMAREVL